MTKEKIYRGFLLRCGAFNPGAWHYIKYQNRAGSFAHYICRILRFGYMESEFWKYNTGALYAFYCSGDASACLSPYRQLESSSFK